MKGRYRAATFFAAFALLFISAIGFAKSSSTPEKSSSGLKKTKSTSQPASNLNASGIYVVRKGDSLYRIARTYKTTPEALMSDNGLRSSRIKIGQKLQVPVAAVPAAEKNAPKSEPRINPAEALMIAGASQPVNPLQLSESDTQSLRNRLVEAGFQWIGVRYKFSGLSQKSGVDCSGLVKCLFSKFNIDLPRSSREQFKQGERIDRDKLEAGDLVFFSSGGNQPTHVGIYIGNDQFLHAAQKAKKVIVSDLNKFWYKMRYLGARRIMDLWWEDPAGNFEKE